MVLRAVDVWHSRNPSGLEFRSCPPQDGLGFRVWGGCCDVLGWHEKVSTMWVGETKGAYNLATTLKPETLVGCMSPQSTGAVAHPSTPKPKTPNTKP